MQPLPCLLRRDDRLDTASGRGGLLRQFIKDGGPRYREVKLPEAFGVADSEEPGYHLSASRCEQQTVNGVKPSLLLHYLACCHSPATKAPSHVRSPVPFQVVYICHIHQALPVQDRSRAMPRTGGSRS